MFKWINFADTTKAIMNSMDVTPARVYIGNDQRLPDEPLLNKDEEFVYSWCSYPKSMRGKETYHTSIEICKDRKNLGMCNIFHYDPVAWTDAPQMALIIDDRSALKPYIFDYSPVFDHNPFVSSVSQAVTNSLADLKEVTDDFSKGISWLPKLGTDGDYSDDDRIALTTHETDDKMIYLFGDDKIECDKKEELYRVFYNGDNAYNLWLLHRIAQVLKVESYGVHYVSDVNYLVPSEYYSS